MDSLKDKVKAVEKEAIIDALKKSNWVMVRAAKKLGITERMIGYKIKKYGLRIKEVRWIEDTQQSGSEQVTAVGISK
jgi:Nif-specific regulatory protein